MPLPAKNLSVSGTTTLNADVTTTGTQTYTGALALATADKLLTGSTITTNGTVSGAYALKVAGNAVFGNSIDDTVVLTGTDEYLWVTGTTSIYNNTVTTSGYQQYDGAVTLNNSTTLTLATEANNNITFGSSIAGAGKHLTLSPGTGTLSVTGAVGSNGCGLGTFIITNSGGTTFSSTLDSAAVVLTNTTGTITFNDNTTITSATGLVTAAQGYNVVFNGTTNTIAGITTNASVVE